MDLQTSLIEQLAATNAGEPWYGTSRSALLAGLSAQQAAEHSVPGVHSIWEEVLHMTAWTNEVRRRLGGESAGTPIEGDWPAVGHVSEMEWRAALDALDAAHARLLEAVRTLPPHRWSEPVAQPPGDTPSGNISVTGLIVGLAQHDAYHTGQVALLRKAAGIRVGRTD
jgi:uncharacterized damage-inducible protein DinB